MERSATEKPSTAGQFTIGSVEYAQGQRMKTEPQRLYSANEIARELGERRSWVHAQMKKADAGAPQPPFVAITHGASPTLLWPESSLEHWRAYHASRNTVKKIADKYSTYSDHRAVNRVGSLAITWKLWWRQMY